MPRCGTGFDLPELHQQARDLLASFQLAEESSERESTLAAQMAAFDFCLSAFSLVRLLRGTHDASGTFVAVRARATVGSPSWVRMLLRVYQRWPERMGFGVEWVDGEPGLHADDHDDGLLRISGAFAYGLLRGEAGVHRLICTAPEAGGRRQTHFADIEVLPDCDLPPPPAGELLRQTFRLGGQSPYS